MPVYAIEVEQGNSRQELVVIDGQAIIASSLYNSEFIEIDGLTNISANFDGTNLILDGATVMEVHEFEESKDEVIPNRAYARYDTPAFGVPSDYTVYQGVTNRDVKFTSMIRSLTVTVIAAGLTLWTGSTLLGLAHSLLDAAIAYSSDSKTSYMKEYRYGHNIMPGLYHKYVQDWYLNSDYTGYADTSIVYDAWS
jgi:hypothetical protein